MKKRSLVGISDASKILGVSEAALRQWTDEGKVRAFVTPGGHRRYSRSALQEFMGVQTRARSVKDMVAHMKDTVSLHREIAQTYHGSVPWSEKLTEESRQHLAELGRQLLDLVIRYVSQPPQRDETMRLVRDVGWEHGEALASWGVSLTDSLEAFLQHRSAVVNAITHLLEKRAALDARAVESVPLVTHIMDEALVSLVAAHQRCQEARHIEIKAVNA